MPKGLKRALGALLLLFLFYCLLGFLIIPGIGLRVANQQLANYASVPARLERIEFNPFSLELTLWGLHLGQDGQEQVRFQRLYANLELDSLWQRRLHLADVELDAPHTELVFAENGTLNLSRLFNLPPSEPAPAQEEPSQPFPLRIDRIRLAEGSLHFLDRRPSEPVEFVFDPLGFELHNLSTLPDDGAEMTLVATGPHGGKLDWKGDLSIVPFTSKGSITLQGVPLKAWWPYVRDNAPLNLNNGMLSLSSDYHLDLSKDTQLLLDKAAIKLRDLDLSSPQGKPLAKLASLDVAQATLDLAKQEVVVGQIRSQGLEAWAAREKDGQLDWQKLFADFKPYKRPEEPSPQAQAKPADTPQAATSAPQPADKAASEPVADSKPEAAAKPAEDKPAEPSKAPEAVAAKSEPASPAEPAKAPPTAQAPAPAKDAAPAEPAKPWHVVLRDTQLRGYKAHLADRAPAKPVNLEVGPLDLDLQNLDSGLTSPLQLKLKTGLGPRGQIEASGQVTPSPVSAKLKVATRDIDLRVAQAYIDPFIRLELRSGMLSSDLDVDLKGTEPLAFGVNGSAQVTQLHTLDTLKNRDFVKWTKLTLDGLAYKHGDSLVIQTVSLEEPYARFIINEDRSTNVSELIIPQPESASAPAKGSSSSGGSKPLGIRIGGVKINNGSANFADLTLRPDFATAIQQLAGEIGTIDNRNPSPASVDIKGKVDKYAPVTIKGSLNPFSPLEKLDIATSFKRVELTTLTPYSGKFAGYRIRKGRLNLDLHYQITQGKLKADNKVLVEHLQLGEKVDSPDAVDLPVKLAIALLKDANGNIDIQLPVEGDLNNPQFSVMPIVWQTLRNLVVRAVQAPFNFIAGLASGGGGPDLSNVVFAPGSSELDGSAQGNLDKLSAALKQRPALKLEVEGVAAAASDGPLLADKRLQQEYQKNYYSMLQRRGDKVPSDASQLEVPEDLQPILLEGVYRARLKKQPPAEWQELSKDERSAKMRQAVLDSWSDSQLLLRKLGQERATQIKDYLVTKGGLGDDRIYLIDVSFGEAENGGKVATQLHLDSE
ncbi:uncharacterized protein involved in outer membrane biogenesis/outer membrane protein OmpA-like peptidoglycan-associated protein [Pseudomonas nitritireducens]|uniref:Uncharacterized protein involved in outer membrane biogenesis/outer membrane protein OmpA-like peptidoglycan-associated protein n=1 Tax=Pseudomonas nitroreducens TaxID=46680 RepID=A0A7W7KS45_PSENT|nr:DUF748 domain-containing protein [Pseudomonas nitritireducens]MBB4867555.1 uncharacterized protein involved in outer membrane biogenesis/outer membrane protein OmpA-like peptidoglycan-associated protein [Pseudomonas nitritireducens]